MRIADGKEGDSDLSAPQTIATTVYLKLRDDILNGVLKSGSKVRVDWVVEYYEAGASPVREALTRLATEGLLDHRDQRGFSVKPVSAHELDELTRTRCWVEEMGLRQSIGNRNLQWEEQVVLALHRLTRASCHIIEKPSSIDAEWEKHHGAFHRALIAGCGSNRLIRFSDQLADQLYRYRILAKSDEASPRDCLEEHRLIAESALDGDADRAVSVLVNHYEKSAALCAGRFRLSNGFQN
ncbi:GntR family transcriptional regulator [Mesorhizobium loti]|uniref:GntR family transcriptional regulator n=1 Tax=Mesorhizobium loti R88b TaxID=935548 RepID=A0A6M7WXK2_RHILI|nr:GntR family transcriptional regulator [Mesorhizobium loti]QKD05339.1 GntR family transcriptional regulator [Mesorhizobium loti R88b]